MKVCMLTTVHKPFDGRIFHKESKSLSKFYEVIIVAPDEKSWEKSVDNIKIITVKKPKNKLLHFITLWKVFKKGLELDCEVYHCHEPDSLLLGIIIKSLKKNKTKLIYDVHEHWPSEVRYGWLGIKSNKTLKKIIEKVIWVIEQWAAKSSDCIITVNDSIAREFKRLPIRHCVIPNVPPTSMSKTIDNRNNKKDCDIVQMAAGITSHYGINEILFSVFKLKRWYPQIKLKIIGNIKTNVESFLRKYSLMDNVILTGFLPFREMYAEIGKGKIGLVIIKPEFYTAYIALPNKLFDYMLCRLAVVASDLPEIRRIVRQSKSGILVDPDDVEEIINAIRYLLETPAETRKMGLRGRRFIERKMNWENAERKLIELYESLGR